MGHGRVAAVLVAVAAAAAGCSSGGSSSANPPPTSFPPITTAPASPSVAASPTVSASPTPSSTPVGGSACGSGELQLSLGETQGGAGNLYQAVVLTNTSGASCTLRGYPGVSFVDASGAQLGPAAGRTGGRTRAITLSAHGGQASALLHTVEAGNFDPSTCHPRTAAKLRVYPPDTTQSLLVGDRTQVCTTNVARPQIGPLVPGNTAGQ